MLTLTLRRLATHSHIEMNSVDVDFDLTGKDGLTAQNKMGSTDFDFEKWAYYSR